MKLPRDVSGLKLARALRSHGYETTRQTGSHLRLSSSIMGPTHHVTVPRHRAVAVGTLARIVSDVAHYLEIDQSELARQLFGQM
jgi:predicted RNA binding protein YcfA (HicA-like mRNA interferase family)